MTQTNKDLFKKKIAMHSIGHCPRKLAYSILDNIGLAKLMEQVGTIAEPNPRFWDGHVHEALVKLSLAEKGTEFLVGLKREGVVHDSTLDIDGHVDGVVETSGLTIGRKVVPDDVYLLEVKSASSNSWWKFVKSGYQIAFPQYYAQIQAYLNSPLSEVVDSATRMDDLAVEKSEILQAIYGSMPVGDHPEMLKEIPERALIIMKNKESGEMACSVIERDPEYYTEIQQRWVEAEVQVANNKLPPRLHQTQDNDECKYCEFAETCWNSNSALVPKVSNIIVSDEAVQVATQYAQLYGHVKEGTEVLGELRDVLEAYAKDNDKIVVGPVSLTKVVTKRKILDRERVEKLGIEDLYKESISTSYRVTVIK